MIHLSENSLRRIAHQPVRPNARRVGCGTEKPTPGAFYADPADRMDGEIGNWLIVHDADGHARWRIESVAHVDCHVCRMLLDAALERRDVVSLMAMLRHEGDNGRAEDDVALRVTEQER